MPSRHKQISLNAKDGSQRSQCAKGASLILILTLPEGMHLAAWQLTCLPVSPNPTPGPDSLLLAWALS